jgi:hypothetical protein
MLRRVDWHTDTDISDALRQSATSVIIYQSARDNAPEDSNLHQHFHQTSNIAGKCAVLTKQEK